MKRSSGFRVTVVLGISLAGCAPGHFGDAVNYYADQHGVGDAAARRTRGCWYLRFNELMLSDLDEAIRRGQEGDEAELRRQGLQAIRAAHGLAVQSASGEIERLPEPGRRALAERCRCEPTAEALKAAYARQAQEAFQAELARLEAQPPGRLLADLKALRARVEPAPDDKGRAGRQLLFAWGALPARLGVEMVESDLERKRAQRAGKVYEQAAVWRLRGRATQDELLVRYAPTIVIEWPARRDYPADFDRFGEIYLTGDPQRIQVNVNTSRPMVYAYRGEAKIRERRYPQLVYVWWYPFHPEMTRNDPASGRIDGDTLRVTLDGHGRPAVFEVIQSCGCGHLVFVSQQIEDQARREFGAPEPGKSLCVEHDVSGKRDLIVMGAVSVPEGEAHPVVYVLAGYHEVSAIDLESADRRLDLREVESGAYDLTDYDVLERLPLGSGVASMFGPDGLVHNAARTEGYLLAPTGILSAGQPRKRGTQKIRWDEFSFDDPRLLEKTLRFPSSF
ncbi:MAG: CHAD domain-containing protein [Phycisphaerae bacterium]|jgi:hypothetical protein